MLSSVVDTECWEAARAAAAARSSALSRQQDSSEALRASLSSRVARLQGDLQQQQQAATQWQQQAEAAQVGPPCAG